MSFEIIHKTIFDAAVDMSEKEANAACDVLFDRHVRPALDKVLRQFENDDMVITQPIELDLGAITEGDLELSIADKLNQALLKYRQYDGTLSNYDRFIESKTDMFLDYLQKPVPPWSIGKVEDFDLQQLLKESVQKAMASDVYLEQMAALLSDGIETCKRFFGLPFQKDDFFMLLQRLISKSPVLRSRVAPEVINLFGEDDEMDGLLFKEIMHYLFSCALFGTKQEIIFSQMVAVLLGNRRWRSEKSIGQQERGKNVNAPSPKMISARGQRPSASDPSSGVSGAPVGRPSASVPSSGVSGAPVGRPAASVPSSGVSDVSGGRPAASVPSSGVSDVSGGRPAASVPSSGVSDVSGGRPAAFVPSSGVSDVSGGRPAASVPSFSVAEAKEQAEDVSPDFHDLHTEPVAGSDAVLDFSRSPRGGEESIGTVSGSGNAILGQGVAENGRLGEKLQRLIRHIDRIAKEGERFSDVVAEIERVIEELQCDEQWKRLLECNDSSTHALQKELFRLKNQTEEGPNGANGPSDADNVTEKDVLQIAKAIESLRKVETKGRQEGSGMGIRKLATAVMRTQPDLKERIPIYNAGLVLFQPFLISFFDRLGLLESRRRFKSAACQVRAVHLLHELSGFRETPIEHLMLFNKLLCGINIMFPIDIGFEMSETEKLEVERLLRATIGNWTVIRNTSIAGFQESFVRRQGVLERSQDDWILRVESKGIDILLDDVPWDIHLVSFPWNDYLVYVDWK